MTGPWFLRHGVPSCSSSHVASGGFDGVLEWLLLPDRQTTKRTRWKTIVIWRNPWVTFFYVISWLRKCLGQQIRRSYFSLLLSRNPKVPFLGESKNGLRDRVTVCVSPEVQGLRTGGHDDSWPSFHLTVFWTTSNNTQDSRVIPTESSQRSSPPWPSIGLPNLDFISREFYLVLVRTHPVSVDLQDRVRLTTFRVSTYRRPK